MPANVRLLRRRIRSVQSTTKITRAMEMIAASKMRRAQQAVEASRPYSDRLVQLLSHLAAQLDPEDAVHPLMEAHAGTQRVHVVHFTPDRGLCGGLNGNMNRRTGQFMLDQTVPTSLTTVGKKGRDFMVRLGRDVQAVFTDMGDRPRVADITPISHIVTQEYAGGQVDEVYVAYPRFVNVMIQQPVVQRLLPVQPSEEVDPHLRIGYIYEPDIPQVLQALLPRYVEMQIYHALLETVASEQAARMIAMRNATDNANQLLDDLTLQANKARQETITSELLDIVGGVAALEG